MIKQKININYYQVFGISPTATPEDISTAHKALAKKYHPDINSSKDAHEKMAMLNEANSILSDSAKRKMYDNELRQNGQQKQAQESSTAQTHQRNEKAELLRQKAEERLRKVEIAQKKRAEQAQKRAEEAAQKSKRQKIDFDRQDVISELSALVMDDSAKRSKKMDVDEERYHATKVLLSMVRNDDNRLRKMTEEAERKQRIDDILTLVKEINEKKEWV